MGTTKRRNFQRKKNKKYRLKGCGRKPITKDFEEDIIIWINICRRQGLAITTNQIIAYAIKINGNDFKNTYNAYTCWVKRFLKRHNLVIRRASHMGQNISNNYENMTFQFLLNCIRVRKKSQITDNIECIVNVDETPCYLENPSKETIDIKGKKNIEIVTYGKDKCRITAVLGVTASGYKLPPLLILKGKSGRIKEKKFKTIECVKNKTIFIKCQDKAWCTSEIFLYWINNIYMHYQNCVVKKILC